MYPLGSHPRTVGAYVKTKSQFAAVTCTVVDFSGSLEDQTRRALLADMDEAERRGGCFFAQMGQITKEGLQMKPD